MVSVMFVNNYNVKWNDNWQHRTYCCVIVISSEEYTCGRERVHSLLDYVRFNPLR